MSSLHILMRWVFRLARSLRLRCPHCDRTPLAERLFDFREHCAHCGYRYLGEEGDFWGQVVLSYAVGGTVGIATGAWLTSQAGWSLAAAVYGAAAAAVLGVMASFPFCKALWIHLLYHTRGQYEEYRPPPVRLVYDADRDDPPHAAPQPDAAGRRLSQ